MKQIKNHRTGAILYEGHFPSLRACAEQAVRDRARLDFADLTQANLVNASLDEAQMRQARFCGANLMGANLSDADLDGADFTNAGLQNACLCCSSLRRCYFEGALFGATDIAGASIDRSLFSTLSAFHLNFGDSASMQRCVYVDPAGEHCVFSQPPLVITGLRCPVIVMDHHVKTDHRLRRFGAPNALSSEEEVWLAPLIGSFRSECPEDHARRIA